MSSEKKSKIHILIFPAGENNSVGLHHALSHNVNIEIFGASSIGRDRHGSYIFQNYTSNLPLISANDFIEKFNSFIKENQIDYIFPTHDDISLYLAENQDKISCKVITADTRSNKVCRDKKLTYELFADCDFCPKIYADIVEFPCFIKPRKEQGARGALLIEKLDDVPKNFNKENYCITEYMPGEEITVDCLTDLKGELKAALPRVRLRKFSGVAAAGKTLSITPEILKIAETLNARLNFLGLWYFQIKKSADGKFKLMEISARCPGTICHSCARGVNLPLLSVYCAEGKEVTIFENPFEVTIDRVLIQRYKINYEYDTVYIDYDDTIIENELVCLPVIKFLYQCKNHGKKLILLTRHEIYFEDSIIESLEKHCISSKIFSEIISVPKDDEKSNYIKPARAIFIDNSYAERKKVYDTFNIPVFDIEGMEVLEDWRC